MFPRVTGVAVVPPFQLDLVFADGTRGIVDCSDLIFGRDAGVFAHLQDPAEFAKAYVHPQSRTITWPNDLDLDPDVLYARAHSIPIPTD
jgi:hypothetical protein